MIVQEGELRHPSPKSHRYNDADDGDNSTVGSLGSAELSPVHIDRLMAKEVGRLSLRDREAIYEEIHGVATCAIEETPELLETSLLEFKTELDKIDSDKRSAYDYIIENQEAENPSKRIVQGKELRLRFLRRTIFDVPQAVDRFARYFQLLQRVYGRESLPKFDGTMEYYIDDSDAMAGFRCGYLQLLPFRDRSGRKIFVFVVDAFDLDNTVRVSSCMFHLSRFSFSTETSHIVTRNILKLKILLYLMWVASEDAETQRNGILMLLWPGCKELPFPAGSTKKNLVEFNLCTPTRTVAYHFCFCPTSFSIILQAMFMAVMKVLKMVVRVKVHIGERLELQYQLMGYGIPVSLIPTTGTGTLKTKVFQQWVKARTIIESSRKKEDGKLKIDCPGVRDVIFRSVGKSCMLNPGNVAFRGIFEKYHSEHIQAGQTEKKNLVWKIVGEIESVGGRFLVWDKKGWWIQLDDRGEIRNKVATSLRGYNKQRKCEDNRQNYKSSTILFQGQDGSKRRKLSDGESSDEDANACQKFMGCIL